MPYKGHMWLMSKFFKIRTVRNLTLNSIFVHFFIFRDESYSELNNILISICELQIFFQVNLDFIYGLDNSFKFSRR